MTSLRGPGERNFNAVSHKPKLTGTDWIELNWCARWFMGYGIKISFPRPPQWRHRSPWKFYHDSEVFSPVILLYLVRFSLCSSLFNLEIARQWSRGKFAILFLKLRSRVRILIYRMWALVVVAFWHFLWEPTSCHCGHWFYQTPPPSPTPAHSFIRGSPTSPLPWPPISVKRGGNWAQWPRDDIKKNELNTAGPKPIKYNIHMYD